MCKFCSNPATTKYGTCATHLINDRQYLVDHADGSGLRSYFDHKQKMREMDSEYDRNFRKRK